MLGLNLTNKNVSTYNSLVYQHKSLINIIKININGLVDKGKFGYGGIFRDNFGNTMEAFASPLSSCIIISVELMTVFKALAISIARNINNIWLKMDGFLLINILSNETKGDAYVLKEMKHFSFLNSKLYYSYLQGWQ